jgi:hypothetical protein
VILEDDEPDDTDNEAEAEGGSGEINNANAVRNASLSNTVETLDLAYESSKPVDSPSPGRWFDLEGDCFVNDEPSSGLALAERNGTTYPAQDLPRSLQHLSGPSLNQPGDDGITRCTSEAPAAQQPQPELMNAEGWTDNNDSELARELQEALEPQALEDQETSSLAHVRSFPCLHLSTEPSPPPMDQEYHLGGSCSGRSQELRHGSLILNQDQDGKGPKNLQRQADDDRMREQRGEKRQHLDETEAISSDIRHSESSDHSHDTRDEDEDDEDPRPAKRRKLPLVSTDQSMYSPIRRMLRPDSLTPPT